MHPASPQVQPDVGCAVWLAFDNDGHLVSHHCGSDPSYRSLRALAGFREEVAVNVPTRPCKAKYGVVVHGGDLDDEFQFAVRRSQAVRCIGHVL